MAARSTCSRQPSRSPLRADLLARAQVIRYRTGADTFRLLVRPSFADYLSAWLADAIDGGKRIGLWRSCAVYAMPDAAARRSWRSELFTHAATVDRGIRLLL